MATSPRDIIAAICPDLASSPSVDVFLDMAVELTSREFFGKLASYAVAYRACHLFMVSGGGGSGNPAFGMGQVASMSEGGLSVSFATGAAVSGSGLETTKYGKLLLDLIKSRPSMGVNTAGLHYSPHGGSR